MRLLKQLLRRVGGACKDSGSGQDVHSFLLFLAILFDGSRIKDWFERARPGSALTGFLRNGDLSAGNQFIAHPIAAG